MFSVVDREGLELVFAVNLVLIRKTPYEGGLDVF